MELLKSCQYVILTWPEDQSRMNSDLYNDFLATELTDEETQEFVTLLEPDENDGRDKADIPELVPILPIRNTVLFPGVVIPITVGRQKSIKLVKQAYSGDKFLGVVAQKADKAEDPGSKDIYQIGTIAKILKMLILPDGNTTIIIQGKYRFKIKSIEQEDPYLKATVSLLDENFPTRNKRQLNALVQSIKDAAAKIMKLNPEIPKEAQVALENIESPSFLTHFLSSNINAEVANKQRLLELNNGIKRSELLLEYMMKDIQMLELKQEIQNKVHSDIDQQQRDFYLRQQIKVIQDELGGTGSDAELNHLSKRAKEKNWPKEVSLHFEKELEKISRMNNMAAEYPVAMNYVELLVDLPWSEFSVDDLDLNRAKRILDRDHYGLKKVKERILEYLAVLKLKDDLKSPILCLYGPPGVGKTSLGKSIAKALKRKYVRMSLGGVHDEAEIRGHRKTYVGAMPGRIIQHIKKAGTSNPVFVLDEIDKVKADFRGDPSSALLEVLDPEQNTSFTDNYVEVPYDLSRVLFIATANSLDTIQPALLDRMEVIEITGYTPEEKVEIAKKHLIPKQLKEHGIPKGTVRFHKKAIEFLIERYTRESGVRNLERQIGKVVRRMAKHMAMGEELPKSITMEEVRDVLGAEDFDREMYQTHQQAGISTGLAWTRTGGEILFIECLLSKGKGKLTLSGQLGDVMKESAQAALTYLRSSADRWDIDHRIFEKYDLHLHVPAGAVPKDGPSAGIAMLCSLASAYTQRQVKPRLAMTGEITLRGQVLPVGGIKEKILAARRSGIKEIILSARNAKQIDEIESHYLKGLSIHYVKNADEVLAIALNKSRVKQAKTFDLT